MAKFSGHPRYIPVIKWQSWEQRALKMVDDMLVPRMQPCIEVRTSDQHFNLISNLKDVWPHDVLVDYANPSGRLTPVRQNHLLNFLQHAVQNGIPASPVLGPEYLATMGSQFMNLAASLPSVAIRLRLDSLTLPSDKLQLVTGAFATLKAANISSILLVDLGVSPTTWGSLELANIGHSLRSLNSIGYQTIHLISGAYPASLAAVKTGIASFDRSDWRFWIDVSASLPEMVIGYGDYGTLSPEWTEKILELRSNRVAIRYTRADNWLIIRADGKKTDDSIAISTILVNNYPQYFKGHGFSYGDKLLAERADPNIPAKKKLCGHYHITEAWSHHIAYVLKEQY